MEITKSKNICVILSSWGNDCSEFPDILNGFTDKKIFWDAWEKTLDILDERDLLSHVAFIDSDQEFLYEWCAEGMNLASEYGLWGSTPWNFSHPYWANWKNIMWYQQDNNNFLNKK